MEIDEISVNEAAGIMGVTVHAVRDLIRRGVLPARKFASVWVLRTYDVRAYQARRATYQRPGPKPTRAREGPPALRQAQGIAPTD